MKSSKTAFALPTRHAGHLRIIPLGGCGDFGMNITAYIVEDRLYIVDCGVSFPDPSKLGVDAVIPDIDEWVAQFGGVYAYIITHAHEDHIGALPHIVRRWPSPIYTTPWAMHVFERKCARLGLQLRYPVNIVNPGDNVSLEDFSVQFVHLNHSIPMACGLHIKSKDFSIFHSGDFKIDPKSKFEPPADTAYLKKIGAEGIDLLLADSTNAHIPGRCPSEEDVKLALEPFIRDQTSATIITTFASNFWRVRSILELAQEHDKRVLALGAGIENCLRIASDLGLYKAPPGLLIDPREAALIDRKQLVVIATGSQGENRSALYRMSIGEYKLFALRDGDSVLFSSRTIPGNERVIQMMTAELERKGAKIITWRQAPNIHCSGHAYRDEVAEMLECLNPKFFAPIHGTFSHMNSNGLIPKEKTFLRAKTYLVESGDVLDFENGTLNYAERITPRVKFVDSDSSTLLTYEELRERLRIGELGCVFVSGVFSQKKNTWLSPPSVSTAGLPSDEFTNVESWQEICSAVVNSAVRNSLSTGSSSDEDVAEEARTHLRRHLFSLLGKKPVVQCHIHLV